MSDLNSSGIRQFLLLESSEDSGDSDQSVIHLPPKSVGSPSLPDSDALSLGLSTFSPSATPKASGLIESDAAADSDAVSEGLDDPPPPLDRPNSPVDVGLGETRHRPRRKSVKLTSDIDFEDLYDEGEYELMNSSDSSLFSHSSDEYRPTEKELKRAEKSSGDEDYITKPKKRRKVKTIRCKQIDIELGKPSASSTPLGKRRKKPKAAAASDLNQPSTSKSIGTTKNTFFRPRYLLDSDSDIDMPLLDLVAPPASIDAVPQPLLDPAAPPAPINAVPQPLLDPAAPPAPIDALPQPLLDPAAPPAPIDAVPQPLFDPAAPPAPIDPAPQPLLDPAAPLAPIVAAPQPPRRRGRPQQPRVDQPNPLEPPAQPPPPQPLILLDDARPWVRVYPPERPKDVRRKFRQRVVGPNNIPEGTVRPLQFFFLFITNAIWEGMVNATNIFANDIIASRVLDGTHRPNTRLYTWVDVTVKEMKRFWALLINMGLAKRKRLESYWSTAPNLVQPFYSSTMSLRRFQMILAMFQVSSRPLLPRGQPGYNPWVKVSDFVDPLLESFRRFFIPAQEVCIDESMIGMKNRCIFIQYMPNKRHSRFGIKKFELCDSRTGYVLGSVLYSGRDFLREGPIAFTQKVVMYLMGRCNLLNKRYHLFTDNYYTKLPLARSLYADKTYLTGTVNKRSKELSKRVLQANLGVGESLYFRKGNENILLLKYKEKATRKPVHLITTACHAENVEVNRGRDVVNKPVVIHRYNQHMGGVDCKDKSIYHLTCTRQTKKYWKKIVYNYMDMAILNAYILYKLTTPQPMSRFQFMNAIVMSLVHDQENVEHPLGVLGDDEPDVPDDPDVPMAVPLDPPENIPVHALTKVQAKRLCEVCVESGVKSRSNYSCVACNVGIHPKCYHKLRHFLRLRRGRHPRHVDSD